MSQTTDTYTLLRAFVNELVRCGMRAACTSPGSRSAPLALTLAREPRLHSYSHIDERCSGFFALGLAKASRLPVAVACTSGTAVAELLPAAIEAREARVPLLVLSADRPAELRENGAGQAIDQLKIFGDAAKWFFEVELREASTEQLRWVRTLACRAYWTTLEGRPGVVHLNFPLREPLVSDDPLPVDTSAREDDQPYVRRTPSARTDIRALEDLTEFVRSSRRGVLIAGREERSPGPPSAVALAQALGWPLLADPLSGARGGDAAIAHYDAMLREPAFARTHTPDFVLRIGDLPVSKPLRRWLASLDGVGQVAVDPEGAWQDPASILSALFALDPATALDRLAAAEPELISADPEWLASWRSADERAGEAILTALGDEELSEPLVARELGVLLPADATLFVASSMPVRDIETFWPSLEDPPRVLCNRGANGIDGIVSSAFGAAAARPTDPVVLLIGDVALAHDIGGLFAAKRLGIKLTIVLIENGGGGIFDFLPVAQASIARTPDPRIADHDLYTTHIATPTGLDFADAGRLYGLAHCLARDLKDFRASLERALAEHRSTLIEVRTRRSENVALHRRVWEEVSRALTPPSS